MRWWSLVLFLGCSGCGLFSPRTAQPPEPGGEGGYRQPTTPAAVMENLRSAITRRDVVVFLRCLVDSASAPGYVYRFEPSAQALARYGEVFARWDREAERRAFLAMVGRVPEGLVPELVLIAPTFELQAPESVVVRAEYQLYVPYRESGVPSLARGSVRWTFVPLPDGLWAIARWRDFDATDTAAVSWSVLKAFWSR